MKYFFNVIIKNCNLLEGVFCIFLFVLLLIVCSFTADTICFIWNKLLKLFETNRENKIKSTTSSSSCNKTAKNQFSSSTFSLNLDEEEKELIEYFIINSTDLICANYSILTSTQQPAVTSTRKGNKTNEALELKKMFQVCVRMNF